MVTGRTRFRCDMERATYNPRIDLIPGDMEYENLRRSIKTYGMIIPVVWNCLLYTSRCV